MFPALPTGRQCTSGASPSASTISNAAVFWPSRRSGFTELTRATGWSTASLRASSRQSSKLPSTWSSFAPWTRAWASLPRAILPRGTSTAQVSPALAAYAAALALVFPVEAQMTAFAPRAAAMLTATVMPRSLNEPVGLTPSTLRYTTQPVISDSTGAGISGVDPSPREITGAPSGTGSHSAYRRMTPPPSCRNSITAPSRALRFVVPEARKLAVREGSFVALPLDPHHAGDGPDHVHRAEVGDAGGQRGV